MARHHDSLLKEILSALVREWGLLKVRQVLDEVSSGPSVGEDQKAESTKIFGRTKSDRKKASKLSALDLIEKLENLGDKRAWMIIIAKKFEQKTFLPSVADIREFLLMTGAASELVRDRPDGFRQVLNVLVGLPPDQLERLANGSRFSGPAQLGPLADAIRSTGEAMRRQEATPTDVDNSATNEPDENVPANEGSHEGQER